MQFARSPNTSPVLRAIAVEYCADSLLERPSMFTDDRDRKEEHPGLTSTDSASTAVGLLGEDAAHIPVDAEAIRIANDICRTVRRNPESARAAALRLVGLLTPPAAPEAASGRGRLAPWQRRKVDQYVRDHLQDAMRVEELANHVSLSVSHFHRVFRETFGESPRAYIARLRVHEAKRLMSRTPQSLTQIALACGFADPSHLSKVFRRLTAETPSAWRRRNDARVDAEG